MVLTHLVLNDMIKVKGCTHELAKCIEDNDFSIQNLARQFFAEFASKSNNNIYNILPDTIGQLSADESIDSATFRRISKYLVQYVDKDWHFESLMSKICHRISTTTQVSQWHDFIFTLSLFPINEKTFKSVSSSYKAYKDALANDKDAHNMFMAGIVSKCKKLATSKPELEVTIKEWIGRIQGLSRDALEEKKNEEEEDNHMEDSVEKSCKESKVVLQDENSSLLNVMSN